MLPTGQSPTLIRSACGDLLRVNAEFTEELGLTSEALRAKPLVQWLHPDDRVAFEEILERGEGKASARHRTGSGGWAPFDWKVCSSTGEVVVLGVQQSERGENPYASKREASGHTIEETLDAMARIVEAKNPGMKCSILLVDENREVILGGAGPSLPEAYNRAVEGLRVGPAVGSCGTAVFWNMPVIVEDIARDPLWKDLRDAAETAGVATCWSHPIHATDGKVLGAMALYDVAPGRPAPHQMNGLAIAARMVGLAIERDRLEEQLRRAVKFEALGVLAGGVAHDFNNLLVAILGNAELLLDQSPSSGAQSMLEEIVNASVSASELCDQMLAYAGCGTHSYETVECNGLVRELGGLLRVALSKKVQLVYELSPEPLGLRADRSQLRQVVLNLITNASEAIGDVEGKIVLHTVSKTYTSEELELLSPEASLEPGEYVCLSVRDDGSGMESSTQSKIFDPFFSTKAPGRGLGLAAVQGIVRSHGGAITLQSSPGVGTTFRVLLPREPIDPDILIPAPSKRHTTSRSAKLLVVDDEASVRRTIGGILEQANYSVVTARDGQEALELFRRDPAAFDCVLLDLSMPRLDGAEVFRLLRKIRTDVPILLSSGYAEQDLLERFHGESLAGIIHKPPRMEALLAKVAEVLEASGR